MRLNKKNFSAVQLCQNLPRPANGGNFSCTDGFYEMSVCQFSCPDGFCQRLPGSASCVDSLQGSTLSTTCNIAKSSAGAPAWSSPVPYCERGNCSNQLSFFFVEFYGVFEVSFCLSLFFFSHFILYFISFEMFLEKVKIFQ